MSRDGQAGEPGWPGRVSQDGRAGEARIAGMAGRITRMVSVQWEMEPCIIEILHKVAARKGSLDTKASQTKIEQVMGIEPTYLAWRLVFYH